MTDWQQQYNGRIGVQCVDPDTGSRHLTIGLGSAFDAFAHADEVDKLIVDLSALCEERFRERLTVILDQYQEQPHLLDPHLPGYLSRLIEAILRIYTEQFSDGNKSKTVEPSIVNEAHSAAFCAQQMIKVRGHKVSVRHFPHEVHHVEAVLEILETQNAESSENWETRYVLLLWMSMLVLIPFHLSRFDTNPARTQTKNMSSSTEENLRSEPSSKTVIERIMIACKRYLPVGNKNQQAASILAAKFLTRPEIVKLGHLAEFLDWIAQQVTNDSTTESGKTGVLLALAAIFKHGKREDILEHAPRVLKILTDSTLKQSKNIQIRKLTIKIIQRLGLTFLKAKVASWRYQRGARSLAMTLGGIADPKIMKLDDVKSASSSKEQCEEEEDYDIPEEVEKVIEELLEGIKSSETIIRWSAAKGIGRITGRLPKELADEVVSALLELFDLKESDGAWHGGCLAVAELARRGLLIPERIADVVRITKSAFVYDERRGNFSVGSHVRDAACYVSWALARAFSPKVLAPYLPQLASSLLTVAVFDREVNCRRAASAAFQENIGRQGADCLTHAIDILTTVDYHAVGSRPKCYTVLALKLATFDRELYGTPLVTHLLAKKVGHWDASVRELTALSLGCMAQQPALHNNILSTVLPELLKNVEETRDLFTRHGSMLAIGQIVLGISLHIEKCAKTGILERPLHEVLGGPEIINRIKVLVSLLERKMALRGSGGEIIRSAVTAFIQNLSVAHFPVHGDKETLDHWKITLDDNLCSTDPTIQENSVLAAAAYVKEYCTTRESCDEILKSYLSNLDSSELHRRGFSLAIGSLPQFALSGRLDQILAALIARCTVSPCAIITSLSPCRGSGAHLLIDRDGKKTFGTEQERWVEGRRDVVKAISRIVITVGVHEGNKVTDFICEANIVPLYECYLRCLDDYTIDRRGDVGAWVREAAMSGLEELTLIAARSAAKSEMSAKNEQKEKTLLPEVCVREMMTRLAQQAVEKIDRTRGHAAKIFGTILFDEYAGKSVPRYNEILEIFLPILRHSTKDSSMDFESLMLKDNEKLKKSEDATSNSEDRSDNIGGKVNPLDSFGWTVESATFPYFTALLRFQEYRERVILGQVVSVGGLTERLVIHSSKALYSEIEKWETMSQKTLRNINGETEELKCETNLKIFCDALLLVFEKNKRVDRITVPLFKFAERLLTSGHLDPILSDDSSKFAFEFFSLTKREVCGGSGAAPCNDPHKLMSAVDVLCALIQTEEQTAKQKCLVQLSIFLCHKFPRIRKATASKLFEALLTYPNVLSQRGPADEALNEEEIDEKLDIINGILSDTTWDTTPVEQLRHSRNKLCDLLGVPAPALVKKPVL